MHDTIMMGPLAATYSTQGEAAAARRHLVAHGVSPFAISVLNVALPGEATSASPLPTELHGVWAKLKDLIAFQRPKLPAGTGSFANRPAILTVDPPATARAQIIRLIQETEPEAFSPDAAAAPASDPSI